MFTYENGFAIDFFFNLIVMDNSSFNSLGAYTEHIIVNVLLSTIMQIQFKSSDCINKQHNTRF
jgi:hypothetical protein